jgi:hypothetical protein
MAIETRNSGGGAKKLDNEETLGTFLIIIIWMTYMVMFI